MDDLKARVKRLLRDKKYQEILDRFGAKRKTVRVLRSILYEEEALVRWRAVSMIGRLAALSPKLIHKEVDRLLWLLNDEAGCIGRSVPETLGEIGRADIGLAKEAVTVVIEYLNDPETCRPPNRNLEVVRGVLWAIGRVGSKQGDITKKMIPVVQSFLDDPDPGVRGHAAWCLGQIGSKADREKLKGLKQDKTTTLLYEDDELQEKTVAMIAEEASERLVS